MGGAEKLRITGLVSVSTGVPPLGATAAPWSLDRSAPNHPPASGVEFTMWAREKCSAVGGAVLLSALSAFTGTATAQPQAPPSDEELHSMYCAEVLRTQITLQQHMISASSEAAGVAQPELRAQWIDTSAELLQQLARLEGVLYRLQLYMLPRIPAIDSLALAAAIRRADADVEEAPGNDVLLTQVNACENPTWLDR